jgi:hypothetical protein
MAVINTINTLSQVNTLFTVDDTTAPYNFQDWKIRNSNISPGELYTLYTAYLKAWYIRRDVSNVVSTNYVKEYYKTFLKTLGLAPRNEQESILFNNVDLNNDLSLQAAIVGYARRLKDIAVYLANKRNDVYYSKLKNNLVGTDTSLERLFYSYILNAFTRKITPDGVITTSFVISSPDILTSLPYLNTIAETFSIQIEEIYDTNNYFDRDPSVPISNYTSVAPGIPGALYSASNYNIPEEYLIVKAIEGVAIANVTSMTSTKPTYFTFLGDDFTSTFSIPGVTSSRASDYQVSIDGVLQTPNDSYTVSATNQTITFDGAPPINCVIVIVIRY